MIEGSRRTRLDGKTEHYRVLRRDEIQVVSRDVTAIVRGLRVEAEVHLNTSGSRLAYRAILKLRSTPHSRL